MFSQQTRSDTPTVHGLEAEINFLEKKYVELSGLYVKHQSALQTLGIRYFFSPIPQPPENTSLNGSLYFLDKITWLTHHKAEYAKSIRSLENQIGSMSSTIDIHQAITPPSSPVQSDAHKRTFSEVSETPSTSIVQADSLLPSRKRTTHVAEEDLSAVAKIVNNLTA